MRRSVATIGIANRSHATRSSLTVTVGCGATCNSPVPSSTSRRMAVVTFASNSTISRQKHRRKPHHAFVCSYAQSIATPRPKPTAAEMPLGRASSAWTAGQSISCTDFRIAFANDIPRITHRVTLPAHAPIGYDRSHNEGAPINLPAPNVNEPVCSMVAASLPSVALRTLRTTFTLPRVCFYQLQCAAD
jgi:hypothetical protein